MSFSAAGIIFKPYIGAAFTLKDQRLCQPMKAGETPKSIPLNFLWANYGASQANPNVGAVLDVSNLAQGNQFSGIRGIYIDNTGSDASISVYFPDTGFTASCGPYSTEWWPVITNGFAVQVAAQGLGTDDLSATAIYLLNHPVMPSQAVQQNYTYPLFRSSPSLSRGLNIFSPGFNSPAIGDQWVQGSINIAGQASGTTVSALLFGSPYTQGGIITVTDLEIYHTNSGAALNDITVQIVSNGASGVYWKAVAAMASSLQPGYQLIPLTSKSGLQHKLNAAETWSFAVTVSNNVAAGADIAFNYNIGFSYQGTQTQAQGVFGNINARSNGGRSIGGGQPTFAGIKFIAPANANLLSVSLPFLVTDHSSFYHLELWTDNAGNPGAQVGSDSQSIQITGDHYTLNFVFNTPPSLINGNTYWIVVVPETAGASVQIDTYIAVDNFGAGRNNAIAGLAAGQLPDANEKWMFQGVYLTA